MRIFQHTFILLLLFFCCIASTHAVDNTVYSVDFSTNGTYFITGGDKGKIDIWKTMNQSLFTTLPSGGLDGKIVAIKFSESGQYVLAGDDNGYVILLHTIQKKVLAKKRLGSYINVCEFSDDEKKILVATTKRLLILDKEFNIKDQYNQKAISSASFNTQGDFVVSCFKDQLLFSSLENFIEPITTEVSGGTITDVDISPNGEWIVSASSNNSVNIWKKSNLGIPVYSIFNTHQDEITNVQFVNDNYIFTTSINGEVKLWNIFETDPIFSHKYSGEIQFNAFRFNHFISQFIIINNESNGYLKVEIEKVDPAVTTIKGIRFISDQRRENNRYYTSELSMLVNFDIISNDPNLKKSNFQLMVNSEPAIMYVPFGEEGGQNEEEEENTLATDELFIADKVGEYYIYRYRENIVLNADLNNIYLRFGNSDAYHMQSETVKVVYK